MVERSRLFTRPLPKDLASLLVKDQTLRAIDDPRVWLSTQTDLNLRGQYEEVYILATEDDLITAGMPHAGAPLATRLRLSRQSIAEFRTRQGVGGGFLEARVDGIFVEVLAYSNAQADRFALVASRLKDWLHGDKPRFTPQDDEDPRRCPKCGMVLEFRGDICRRCVDRSAVMIRVLRMMKPYAGKATAMMTLVLVGIGLALVPQQLVRLLINNVLDPLTPLPRHDATVWLLALVGALAGAHLVQMLVHMISGRLSSFIGTQITYDMRARVFGHLTGLGVNYYDRYNVGQLMTRVAGDTEQMKGFVHQLTGGFLAQLIQVVAVGAVMFSLRWELALYTLLPAPLVMLSAMFFWKRIYPRYYRVWDANSKLHGALNSILSGIRVVKAFGQEDREKDRFAHSSGYVRDSFRGVEYQVAFFNPGIGLIFQLGGLIVWFAGGNKVLDGQMRLGDLMAFLGYLWMFYQPLGQLTQLTNWLTQFLTATQRTFEILDTRSQIIEVPNAKPIPQVRGGIVFENVVFGYNRHEPVLKGVSFEIKPGEHIGVVGKSGSGKTTIINLMARFYDVDHGRILIDGVDVRQMRVEDIRRSVGIVLQEPFLFRGTIASNLTYGRSAATAEQLLEAAKAANAHAFIMKHPLGYDTYIGDRGAGLSGGERQRISIARALLYDPPILVLDEATSSVDTESEQLIQDALGRVTAGRTTIAIAHRLSTLKASDRIIVLDRGRIVEQGSHAQLLENKGLYHRLVKIQTELNHEPTVDRLTLQK